MTTANVHIGEGMSYGSLSKNHYELERQESAVRDQNKYTFPIHEHVILSENAYTELQDKQTEIIVKRDRKYQKRGEHNRVVGTIENYYQRKNKNPKIKHKQANHFPLVITASNYDDYENLASVLVRAGVTENEFRHAHVNALKKSVEAINDLGIDGLSIDEYYVHANEKGVPHLHARMLLDSVDGHGNPSGNYGKVLQNHYNDKYIKSTMERFRADTDTSIMDNLRGELSSLVRAKELSHDELELVAEYSALTRTQGPIFQNQQEHINHALQKRYEKEIDEYSDKSSRLDNDIYYIQGKKSDIENAEEQLLEYIQELDQDYRAEFEYLEISADKLKERDNALSTKERTQENKEIEYNNKFNFVAKREKELSEKENAQKQKDDAFEEKIKHVNSQIAGIKTNFQKQQKELAKKVEKQQKEKAEIELRNARLAAERVALDNQKRHLEEEEKRAKEEAEKQAEIALKEKRNELRKERLNSQLDMLDSVEESLSVYDPTGNEYLNYAKQHELTADYYQTGEQTPINHQRETEMNILERMSTEHEDVAETRVSSIFKRVRNAVRELPKKVKELTNRVLESRIGVEIDKRVTNFFDMNFSPTPEATKTSVKSDMDDILLDIFAQDANYVRQNTKNRQNSKGRDFDYPF